MKKLLSLFLLLASALEAHQCHDFLIRGRALYIDPNDVSCFSSTPGGGATIRESWTGEVDFSYFFSDHLALELIVSAAKEHVKGRGALEGADIGTTWMLPPTLTLQYHFLPCSRLQPYVGAGPNFTLFFSKHSGLPNTNLHLKNSWGWDLEAGADFYLTRCWFFNVDAKYINVRSTVTLSGQTNTQVAVEINPWVIGIGLGRSF